MYCIITSQYIPSHYINTFRWPAAHDRQATARCRVDGPGVPRRSTCTPRVADRPTRIFWVFRNVVFQNVGLQTTSC